MKKLLVICLVCVVVMWIVGCNKKYSKLEYVIKFSNGEEIVDNVIASNVFFKKEHLMYTCKFPLKNKKNGFINISFMPKNDKMEKGIYYSNKDKNIYLSMFLSLDNSWLTYSTKNNDEDNEMLLQIKSIKNNKIKLVFKATLSSITAKEDKVEITGILFTFIEKESK